MEERIPRRLSITASAACSSACRRRRSIDACHSIGERSRETHHAEPQPIVLVSPQIRAAVKQITENHIPQLVVLSFNEITRDTKIVTTGIVSDGDYANSK